VKRIAQAGAVGLVVALLGLLVWRVAADDGGVAEKLKRSGAPVAAPAFTLPQLGGGGDLSLASLRGKPVVINFWATWCVPCKEEAPLFEAAWKEHRDDGLVVLGVALESFRGDIRRFVERYGLTYPQVVDKKKGTVAAYGLTGYPETFFVARDGKVVAHAAGQVRKADLRDGIRLALRQ
jgi:cytochrome c biogenesis protein CcmG/thiol:disulfide interchange protein DsbE